MKFKIALFAAACTLACQAQATSTDWGTHDPLEVAAAITPVGSFSDLYLFTLGTAQSLSSTAVTNNLGGVLGLADGKVTLFQETGVVDTALGDFGMTDTTGSISHAFGALQAGDYYYQVSGMGTGKMGGFYTLSSTVTAVPEPESVALLLAGLGALGFVAKRRQPRDAR